MGEDLSALTGLLDTLQLCTIDEDRRPQGQLATIFVQLLLMQRMTLSEQKAVRTANHFGVVLARLARHDLLLDNHLVPLEFSSKRCLSELVKF